MRKREIVEKKREKLCLYKKKKNSNSKRLSGDLSSKKIKIIITFNN